MIAKGEGVSVANETINEKHVTDPQSGSSQIGGVEVQRTEEVPPGLVH